MSFSRSKRFSPALNECLPGPAHYYVNWGSLGLLKPIFSKHPRLTDTCRKTTPKKAGKTSPQKVDKQGQSPEQKKYSSTEQHKKVTIPEFSEPQLVEDAAKKEEILGVEPEEVKYQIPGLHKNVTVRKSFRKRMEEAARNLKINQPIQQAGKQVEQSMDDTSEFSLTERSCEISINTILFDEHNKENLESSTEDEVSELLDLCTKETDFFKKMEMLQRLSVLQKRENERTVMNLSEIVHEGHMILNNTL